MINANRPEYNRLVEYRVKRQFDPQTKNMNFMTIVRVQRQFATDLGHHTVRVARCPETRGVLCELNSGNGLKDTSGLFEYSKLLAATLKNDATMPTRADVLKIASLIAIKTILLLSVPAAVVTLATVWFCPIVSVVAFGIAALAGVVVGVSAYRGMQRHVREAKVLDFNMQSVLNGLEHLKSGGEYDIEVPKCLESKIKHINLPYVLIMSDDPAFRNLLSLFSNNPSPKGPGFYGRLTED